MQILCENKNNRLGNTERKIKIRLDVICTWYNDCCNLYSLPVYKKKKNLIIIVSPSSGVFLSEEGRKCIKNAILKFSK